jgi:hypothetical protein
LNLHLELRALSLTLQLAIFVSVETVLARLDSFSALRMTRNPVFQSGSVLRDGNRNLHWVTVVIKIVAKEELTAPVDLDEIRVCSGWHVPEEKFAVWAGQYRYASTDNGVNKGDCHVGNRSPTALCGNYSSRDRW